jgi:hypothetical protein
MAVPNVNQAYDLITIKSWKGVFDGSEGKTKNDVLAKIVNPGDVAFITGAEDDGKKCGRFFYKDNDTVKSSVLLNAGIFSEVQGKTRIAADRTKYKRKTVVVKPVDELFDGDGKVQSNSVAMVTLVCHNFQVVGDYSTYQTEGVCQLNTQMGKLEMLFKLAKSLVQNMSRGNNLGVEVMLGTADDSEATGFVQKVTQEQIKAAKSYTDLTTTTETTDNGVTTSTTAQTEYDCIAIQEVPMKWELGRFYFERPNFDVTTNLVEVGIAMPVEMAWAEDTITDNVVYDNAGVPNGRMVAEIEYASQAQRGDFWGKGGYPYTNHAEGLVDPTKEYDIAILRVTYRGDAEDVQYSPKELFLAMEKANSADTPLNAVMTAIKNYL